MADPHSTVAGALIGAGAGASTIFMGAQVDALIIGLVAAVFVSIQMDMIDNRLKAAAAVLFASLLAGYASPVAAEWVAGHVEGIGNAEALRLLMALAIGGVAPSLVPLGIRFLSKKIDGGEQ
jgi:hypothetical protein